MKKFSTKTVPIIANILLFCWFFLDMIGLYLGDKYLVTTAYKDDGIFMLIYILALLLFIFKEKIGKYFLCVWLALWGFTQFISHWYYTISGGGEAKISVFKDAIKLFQSDTIYIPDLYHIILHGLILLAFVLTCLYLLSTQNSKLGK